MNDDQEIDLDEALADNVLDRFIRLVLVARIHKGSWTPETGLARFHIALLDESDEALVQLNDESTFWTQPRLARSVEAGETVLGGDILSDPVPPPAGQTRRYITGTWVGDRWSLEMKLTIPHPMIEVHLEAATEFAETAHDALASGRLRAFGENAFHAAEHLAKAELLCYAPALPELAELHSHKAVATAYHQWAKLGNTQSKFAKLLSDLTRARSGTTYLRGDSIDAHVAREQAAVLADMLTVVRELAHREGPREVRLTATRPIDAGQLIGRDDVALRPTPT